MQKRRKKETAYAMASNFKEVLDIKELNGFGVPSTPKPFLSMEGSLQLAGIVEGSITDGPGFRLTLFTQGCPHHCEGCHNPQTHAFSGGTETSLEDVLTMLTKNPLYAGVTLSGGEPFCQAKTLAKFAKLVKEAGYSVMTYTGYTLEALLEEMDADRLDLLKYTDILVDGAFEEEKRSHECFYRGSMNQRIFVKDKGLNS